MMYRNEMPHGVIKQAIGRARSTEMMDRILGRILRHGWRWALILGAIGWMTATAAAWAADAAATPATRSVIEMQDQIATDDPAQNVRDRVATGSKVDPSVEQSAPGEPPQVYIVRQGDTLWDIASRFLNDPFRWPQLHENNPQIMNPHLIYPGEPITVYPRESLSMAGQAVVEAQSREDRSEFAEEEIEAEAVAITEEAAAAELAEEAIAEPEQLPDMEREAREQYFESFDQKDEIQVFDAEAVELLSKKRAVSQFDRTRFVYPRAGTEGVVEFVDKSFVSTAGVILGQEDEKKFDRLSVSDIVYINRGTDHGVAPGHRFWVVRDEQALKHPHTGKMLGNIFRAVGILQVKSVQPGLSTAVIKVSYEEISPGDEKFYGIDTKDYVIPYYQPPTDFPIRVSEKQIEAVLVGTQGKIMGIMPKMMIYLDKGENDGLTAGTLLSISRQNRTAADPELLGRVRLPDIPIGEAIVVRTTGSTATAYVTYLLQEAMIGDRVLTADNSILFKRPTSQVSADAETSRAVYEVNRERENPFLP